MKGEARLRVVWILALFSLAACSQDVVINRNPISCDSDDSPNICDNFARISGHQVNSHVKEFMSLSYEYKGMGKFFKRDDQAYPGFSKAFTELSKIHKHNAQEMIEFLKERGSSLHLKKLQDPVQEWRSPLNALKLSFKNEKNLLDNLLEMQAIAKDKKDPQFQKFIESSFLPQQVNRIKKMSDAISRLKKFKSDPVAVNIFDSSLESGKISFTS